MSRIIAFLSVIFILCVSAVMPSDLYQVNLSSRADEDALVSLNLDVLLRLPGGYLVLAGPEQQPRMAQTSLSFELVALDVDRTRVALDISHDSLNFNRYGIVYEDRGLRLLRVEPADLFDTGEIRGLAPIPTARVKIAYSEPRSLLPDIGDLEIGLDSLISLVDEDSLRSYVEHIQTYVKRTPGTDANEACRDWLIGKLEEFGYDSVTLDPFPMGFARGSSDIHNVCATKVGSELPLHQIVIGAHYDVVGEFWSPACPGADDNGSGMAGVLEIARILKNVDTRVSFTFVLFNAEESGCYGAAHYAAQAAERGDNILYMQNLDMIGYYENDTAAYVYGCPTYTELWSYLADSLEAINITATIVGANQFDDMPFFQNGFDAILLHEYVFNGYYHSTNDSAVYISFDYLSRMIMGTLATAYAADQACDPPPSLAFSYPDGVPPLLFPGQPTTVRVNIQGYAGGRPVAGTGELRYAVPGSFLISVPLVDIGADLYEATIPAQASYTRVTFQFVMSEESTGRYFDPPVGNQYTSVAATSIDTTFADDFETNLDWAVSGQVSAGDWVRVVPYFWGLPNGAPGWDASGTGRCFTTGQQVSIMVNEVDDGTTILTSPYLNLSTDLARISYHRYYYTSTPEEIFTVWISADNGDTWSLVETIGPEVNTSGGWFKHNFWVNDFLPPDSQMLVKFEATDEGIDQTVEAGIDNFVVEQYLSEPQPVITTEYLPDWTVGFPYSQQLTSTGGYGMIAWTDPTAVLDTTGLTLTVEGLLTGTPVATGAVSLTVRATDELSQSDEKFLTFQLNPVLSITTDSVPDASQGAPYSFQMQSEGGTGQKYWNNSDYGLKYSGLTLAPDGLLSGTPSISGERTFTALVADGLGAETEKLFVLQFKLDFICGDLDNDGADINISDLTYFVEYMFVGGPPPPIEGAADVDGSGTLDVSDVTYFVDFLFGSGPSLNCQ